MGLDAVLINRADVLRLKKVGIRQGCCGPDGMDGPNLACRLGHPVAVEMSACFTPDLVYFPATLIVLEELAAG
jgi:hypothetical protein